MDTRSQCVQFELTQFGILFFRVDLLKRPRLFLTAALVAGLANGTCSPLSGTREPEVGVLSAVLVTL